MVDLAAGLDIGSNAIKLLVATRGENGLKGVYDRAVITRLSEGMQRTGALSDVAMERTLGAIAEIARASHLDEIPRKSVVITAPGRVATNRDRFLARLDDELGLQAEVVSADREAELALTAARAAFPDLERMVAIDLGGASTEFSLLEGGRRGRWISVDVGVVRLHEAFFLGEDPLSSEAVSAAEAFCREQALRVGPALGLSDPLPTVLSCGTATALAHLDQDKGSFDPEGIQGTRLHRAGLDKLVDKLTRMTLDERRHLPSLDPARADIIVTGALWSRAIALAISPDGFLINDRGLRWGLVAELLR